MFISTISGQTSIPATKIKQVAGLVKLKDSNEPAISATIRLKGTNNGIVTDISGKFILEVSEGDTLVCSFVGYNEVEVPVRNLTKIDIALTPAVEMLEAVEIVAVGYGKLDRERLSSSVSTIEGKDIDKSALSLDNALTGKLAGVQVTSSSGQPGSASSITIRGVTSFSGANNPLIVIDGIPIYGSNRDLNTNNFDGSQFIPGASFGGTSVSVSSTLNNEPEFERNPLAHFNPEDIESISVLKDAYATAIYGSRGAAGVILITTKKGKTGKGSINLNYEAGVGEPIGTPDLLTGPQYGELQELISGEIGTGIVRNYNTTNNVDWLDQVIRPARSQSVNVSMSGGNQTSRYYTSLSYTNNPSYIINNDFERYSSRINFSFDPIDEVTIGVNYQFVHTNNSSLNAPRIYSGAVRKAPNVPVTDTNGNYIWNSQFWDGNRENADGQLDNNPVGIAHRSINELKDNRNVGNVFVELRPLEWISWKSEVGIDAVNSEANSREQERIDELINNNVGGNAAQTIRLNNRLIINNTLTLDRTFDKHNVNILLGHSFESSKETTTRVSGAGFFDDDILSIGAAEIQSVNRSDFNEWALESYFGRINYIFDQKYIVGATYRIDGSSRFARNEQYVGFPSFSAGWNISQEDFLSNTVWLNNLKLRTSFGFSGVNGTGQNYYGTQGVYNLFVDPFTYGDIQGITIVQPVNPNLKWERTRQLDVGLEGSFFNNSLGITVDYYYKLSKDVLLSTALASYKGFSSVRRNIGSIENKGFELLLDYQFEKNDFSVTSSFNIATNRNKILKLNNAGEEISGAELNYKYFKEGEPAGQFFLYQWHGVDPETGDAQWVDKDGNITNDPPASFSDPNIHRKPYGTSLPDFFGGLNNTISYKNWSLTSFFTYSIGSQLFNGTRAELLTYTTGDKTNLSTEILNYWQEEGDRTDIPEFGNSSLRFFQGGAAQDYLPSRNNSRYLEDNSYIRLRTLTLGYELPEDLINKAAMSGVRVYVTGTNIWTWTRYSGVDPEVTIGGSNVLLNGYDELTMPQVKSWIFGINMTF